MSQGKKRNKEKIIEVLKEYFKLGYSVTRACEIAGIPQSTVATWIAEDEELRLKITAWQNEPNIVARRNWIEALEKGKPTKFGDDKYTPAKDWLERREKDDFSTRGELTGKDGQELKFVVTRDSNDH